MGTSMTKRAPRWTSTPPTSSHRLSVNLSINNVLNAPRVLLRYGGQTPGHARVYQRDEYGTRVAVGVKGTF